MTGLIFKIVVPQALLQLSLGLLQTYASYQVEPKDEGSIKSAQPFLRTSQSASFGTRFHGYGQYSTYAYINTLLTTIVISLGYGESSLRISS